ncbi:MAG: hypothetical protein QOK47_384 [Actinomycetota bacterium]|jgi:PPOX class probable F420-dependent enzyme|nr:hypothetical protein [Actinomycetota bacterium]
MPGGSCSSIGELPRRFASLIDDARRGVLGTIAPDGTPRLVPVCYAVRATETGAELVFAIDQKPKATRRLARVNDIARDKRATLLIDRWSEKWAELAWVRLDCVARVEPPGFALEELQARYHQYQVEPPDGDTIVLVPTRLVWWSAAPS